MLLGIPFHAGLAFSGENWVVTASSSTPSLAAFAEFLHVWRMPTFFVVAGFFSTLILSRIGEITWLRRRSVRLGIPLVFGTLLLSPVQWFAAGYYRTESDTGAVDFFLEKVFPPSSWWTMHLWFLLELLIYCALLALLYRLVGRSRLARLNRVCFNCFNRYPTLITLCAVGVAGGSVVAGLALWQVCDADTLFAGLLSRNFVIFAPAFALGCLLGTGDGSRLSGVRRISKWTLCAVAFAATAGVIFLKIVLGVESNVALALTAMLWVAGGLTVALLCIRVAARYLDRPHRSTRTFVDSSLVVYLVHQPLIILSACILKNLEIDPWLKWSITLVCVLLLSIGIYEVVNRIATLRWMFTGTRAQGSSFFTLRSVEASRSAKGRGTTPARNLEPK